MIPIGDKGTESDLFFGDGLCPPNENSEGVDAHQNGHRQQNSSYDFHCVVRFLHATSTLTDRILFCAQETNSQQHDSSLFQYVVPPTVNDGILCCPKVRFTFRVITESKRQHSSSQCASPEH